MTGNGENETEKQTGTEFGGATAVASIIQTLRAVYPCSTAENPCRTMHHIRDHDLADGFIGQVGRDVRFMRPEPRECWHEAITWKASVRMFSSFILESIDVRTEGA